MFSIMQLFDMAGMSPQINYFLNKFGEDSKCFLPQKPNLNELYAYYKCKPYQRFRTTLLQAVKQSRYFDIIHIHSVSKIIPIFKLLGKKVILQCHGSDIMENKMLFLSMADHVIYNSKDMEPRLKHIEKKTYLPNFIDTELFKNQHGSGYGSVIILSNNLDKKKTLERLPCSTEIYDLSKSPRINYFDMPQFLQKYKVYYDEKVTSYGLHCEAFSNTGLQALACGLTVVHNNQTYDKLPENCTPEYYIEQLYNVYRKILT